jgi:hypothetical protein
MKTSIPAGGGGLMTKTPKRKKYRKRNLFSSFPALPPQNEAERRPLNDNFPNQESCYLNIKTSSYRTFALHVSAFFYLEKKFHVICMRFRILFCGPATPMIDAKISPTLAEQ